MSDPDIRQLEVICSCCRCTYTRKRAVFDMRGLWETSVGKLPVRLGINDACSMAITVDGKRRWILLLLGISTRGELSGYD